MEFLPLEKDTLDVKRKKSLKERKKKIVNVKKKGVKKSGKDGVKKLVSLKSDKKKKYVTESSNGILQQLENISTGKTNDKIQIHRLFVHMRKIIMNEQDVREIHPDIISIRLPRKKRSKWCWAVFDSAEKATNALNELKDRTDIVVKKPHRESEVNSKKKTKPPDSKLKKAIKSKLRDAWM